MCAGGSEEQHWRVLLQQHGAHARAVLRRWGDGQEGVPGLLEGDPAHQRGAIRHQRCAAQCRWVWAVAFLLWNLFWGTFPSTLVLSPLSIILNGFSQQRHLGQKRFQPCQDFMSVSIVCSLCFSFWPFLHWCVCVCLGVEISLLHSVLIIEWHHWVFNDYDNSSNIWGQSSPVHCVLGSLSCVIPGHRFNPTLSLWSFCNWFARFLSFSLSHTLSFFSINWSLFFGKDIKARGSMLDCSMWHRRD